MSQGTVIRATLGTFRAWDRRSRWLPPILHQIQTQTQRALLDLQLLSTVISTPVTEPAWLPYQPHSELNQATIRGRQPTLLQNNGALITLQHLTTCPAEWFFRTDPSWHPYRALHKYSLEWFSVQPSYKSSSSFATGPVLVRHAHASDL